jgi:hypothetical protein
VHSQHQDNDRRAGSARRGTRSASIGRERKGHVAEVNPSTKEDRTVKTTKLLAVLVGISVLSGCAFGNLKARVVTNRDFTSEERSFYASLRGKDTFRAVILLPLATWGRFAAQGPADGIYTMKFKSVLVPPLVGFLDARGATFDREGERTRHFGFTGLAPLYMHTFCRVKEVDDSWITQLRYTDFLLFFGYGECRGKRVVRVFFCFGAKRKELGAANHMFDLFEQTR